MKKTSISNATRDPQKSGKLTPAKRSEMLARARKMTDADIDRTDPDARVLPPEAWAKAMPFGAFRPLKKAINLRVDSDVLAWFQRSGDGYQTRMNAALRRFMEQSGKL